MILFCGLGDYINLGQLVIGALILLLILLRKYGIFPTPEEQEDKVEKDSESVRRTPLTLNRTYRFWQEGWGLKLLRWYYRDPMRAPPSDQEVETKWAPRTPWEILGSGLVPPVIFTDWHKHKNRRQRSERLRGSH